MVVVACVSNRFEADLLAAKLGAHGVVWQIRSRELVPTTHPIGWLEVLVPADERELADEVLAEDALPIVLDDGTTADEPLPHPGLSPAMRTLRVALGLALAVPLGVAAVLWVGDALRYLDVVRGG
jgi:hypothetical protein